MNENQISLDITGTKVPNQFPSRSATYRIAIVGEAPGETEVETGEPFTGKSGDFLNALLGNAGITRQCCFVGNVCQRRPPGNDIKYFKFDGPEIQEGLGILASDLRRFKPNLCLLCGATPLLAATGEPRKPTLWRGSLFISNRLDSPFYGFKCLATLHPAYILRVYEDKPLFCFDLKRARQEGESDRLVLPQRELLINLTCAEIIDRLNGILPGTLLSLDIEGTIATGMSCLSLADSPESAFLIPFGKFPVEEEARIWRELDSVLRNPKIPKVLQNSLYDRFVLMHKYGMLINNVVEDTMLKSWEIYSELPKALGVQTSIWTREPYYKYERKADDRDTHYRYCCKDSAVTLEICRAQDIALTDAPAKHYRFNMDLLSPLLYMQQRGWNFDIALAREKTIEVKVKMAESLARITAHASYEFNPRSTQQCAKFLYQLKGLPTQYKKEFGRLTTKVTTDTNALLTLGKNHKDPVLFEILSYRRLGKLLDVTESIVDPDGRQRCAYNLVGTADVENVTGRVSCSKSATGSGFNLQTVTKKLRVLYRADSEHTMFQCDLSGADGWTVAAHCLKHGDPTMLHDYVGGLKPAKLIALFSDHPEYTKEPRENLKELCSEVDQDGWLYFSSKRVQHGSNYALGKNTMADQIMKDSFKYLGYPVYVTPTLCEKLQRIYFSRYPGVLKWQNWIARQVVDNGYLTAPSGHVRRLFGRRKTGVNVHHETYRSALSNEPQDTTTYVTNLALWNLWHDPDNRTENSSLKIQPVHQVHDALVGQVPTHLLDWARPKIRQYFDNQITIAGLDLVIPFEGGYGPDWGHCNTPI
jgi:uracil-DNA glycosylase family 4